MIKIIQGHFRILSKLIRFDQMNVILSAAGMNFKKLLRRYLEEFLRFIYCWFFCSAREQLKYLLFDNRLFQNRLYNFI